MSKLKTIKKDGIAYLVPVDSVEPYVIQFKRVVRDCPANEDLRKKGDTHRLLIDYEIIYKGEHVATFMMDSPGGRTYIMALPDRRFIRANGFAIGFGGFSYVVNSTQEFAQTALCAIGSNGMPNPESVRKRDAAQAAKKAEEGFVNRKYMAAGDMHDMLKKLSKAIDVQMSDKLRKDVDALLKYIEEGVK